MREAGDPRLPAERRTRMLAGDGRRRQMNRLAEIMAEGAPSLVHAAAEMRVTVIRAEELWKSIRRGLGAQAR
jgi:hypothetical protein